MEMENEVHEEINGYKSSSGKKKIWVSFIIFVLIIIAIVLYYFLTKKPYQKPELSRNYEMEAEFKKIVESEISIESGQGVVFSINNIIVYNLPNGKTNGSIILKCNWAQNSDIEFKVFQSIADKLLERYPDIYGQDKKENSWVDIECKYV
jgi:hypothetical protein